MKLISFDGRVGANGVEIKTSKTGSTYATFSVANNSFYNGNEKTEWFEVTSFDPNFVEKRAKNIGKGTYVIVNGPLRTEVNVDKTGKLWINHYVTANTVDTPRFGTKGESSASVQTDSMSTFTGGTASQAFNSPAMSTGVPVAPAVVGVSAGVNNESDDLPF